MIFTTETGSVYEVDETNRRIRRLTGAGKPTERVGDGWREYASIGVTVGEESMIIWPEGTPLLPGSLGGLPVTITSRVVGVEG